MFGRLKRWFSSGSREELLEEHLHSIRDKAPVPVIWLFGRTQSGKTSLIRNLTGASNAEIGQGFRPCTKFSQIYQFPSADAPLMNFLDTRGIDEPGYDPTADLAQFDEQAHLILVVAKALDHAQNTVISQLAKICNTSGKRPTLLALTCLHEAYPQQQHASPYPFGEGDLRTWMNEERSKAPATEPPLSEELLRNFRAQLTQFESVIDRAVAIDFTREGEGFDEPNYGALQLRTALQDLLPDALAQTFARLDDATGELSAFHAGQTLPLITGYSTLAATAGAIPLPVADVVLISGIQSRMVSELAKVYGQPMTGKKFLQIGTGLGLGLLARQAGRSLIKMIPWVGSYLGAVSGAALAGASTYALGKAFSLYCQKIDQGHVPTGDELRRWYKDELARAHTLWSNPSNEPKKD